MNSNPDRGTSLASLRHMLFASKDASEALRLYPDGRGDVEDELRRYAMLRFGSAIGFRPPYLYNRTLIERLYRASMPAAVVWGAEDHMVPIVHGGAYAKHLGAAPAFKPIAGAGHAAHLEKPDDVLGQLRTLLDG
jgi:pimeloyl-ACP methyl ester carboxylesterase